MEALKFKELLEDLECPVCTHYMLPPIRQCTVGHSLCNDCFSSVRNCPTCRSRMATENNRNWSLEKLTEKIFIPCKYSERGCTYEMIGSSFGNHQEYCDFGDVKCRFNDWTGQRQCLFDHFKEKHAPCSSESFKCEGSIPNFNNNNLVLHFVWLLKMGDKTFLGYLRKLDNDNYVPWCVYYLGNPAEANNYSYKVIIQHSDPLNKSYIELKSNCRSLKNNHTEDDLGNSSNCVSIHSDFLREFCDQEGNLAYQISIQGEELEMSINMS